MFNEVTPDFLIEIFKKKRLNLFVHFHYSVRASSQSYSMKENICICVV